MDPNYRTYNRGQLKNSDMSGAPTYREFSISLLKLIVKMAVKCQGSFIDSRYHSMRNFMEKRRKHFLHFLMCTFICKDQELTI